MLLAGPLCQVCLRTVRITCCMFTCVTCRSGSWKQLCGCRFTLKPLGPWTVSQLRHSCKRVWFVAVWRQGMQHKSLTGGAVQCMLTAKASVHRQQNLLPQAPHKRANTRSLPRKGLYDKRAISTSSAQYRTACGMPYCLHWGDPVHTLSTTLCLSYCINHCRNTCSLPCRGLQPMPVRRSV